MRKINIPNLSLLPCLEPSKKFTVDGVKNDFCVPKPKALVYVLVQAELKYKPLWHSIISMRNIDTHAHVVVSQSPNGDQLQCRPSLQ